MSEALISNIPTILEESRREYEEAPCGEFSLAEQINGRGGAGRGAGLSTPGRAAFSYSASDRDTGLDAPGRTASDRGTLNYDTAGRDALGSAASGVLALGDNLRFMKSLLSQKEMAGKLDLIYIDPPFFSKSTYDSVINLPPLAGKKLPTIKHFAYDDVWHKDTAAYLKMLCSRFFAMRELLSEKGTIWVHLDWHVVHYVKIFLDAIFGEENFVNEIIWYYKSGGSGKRHFARKHDTILVYAKSKKYYFAPPKEKSYNRGFKPYRFKNVKEYRDEQGWYTMVTMKDVWQIDMVGRTSAERTGYATQKPEALLERIIESATEEGSLCADFFCGSGTLAASAQKLGRRWICCDESPLAISAALKRLFPARASVELLREEAAGAVEGVRAAGYNAERRAAVQSAAGQNADGTKSAAVQNADGGGDAKSAVRRKAGGGKSAAKRRAAAAHGRKKDCRCDFTAEVTELAGSDKELLTITLNGYELKPLPNGLDAEAQATVKKVLAKEPLNLLEYWSVDYDYDGKVFRPEAFFARGRDGLTRSCEKLRPTQSRAAVCVKTVDVFGNSSMNVKEI